MGRDHGFIDLRQQQSLPDRLGERRLVLFHEKAFARKRLNNALALQLGIGLRDGIAVDSQFLGQRTKRRQWFARTQPARGRRIADLIRQLEIDWLASLTIDLENYAI